MKRQQFPTRTPMMPRGEVTWPPTRMLIHSCCVNCHTNELSLAGKYVMSGQIGPNCFRIAFVFGDLISLNPFRSPCLCRVGFHVVVTLRLRLHDAWRRVMWRPDSPQLPYWYVGLNLIWQWKCNDISKRIYINDENIRIWFQIHWHTCLQR